MMSKRHKGGPKREIRPINFLILLIIFFIIEIMILGTDHIRGILVVSGIILTLILLVKLFTKNGNE